MLRVLGVLVALIALTSCAFQRAATAEKAQSEMIGMSKEQILACMGPPQGSSAQGSTEVWSYSSGGQQIGTAQVFGTGTVVGSSHARYCVVNVVMQDGRVSHVGYQGPTGGLMTKGDQCAYAVENCVR
jgi:hypothetical protein